MYIFKRLSEEMTRLDITVIYDSLNITISFSGTVIENVSSCNKPNNFKEKSNNYMNKILSVAFLMTLFVANILADGGVVYRDGGVVYFDGGVVYFNAIVSALTGGVVY